MGGGCSSSLLGVSGRAGRGGAGVPIMTRRLLIPVEIEVFLVCEACRRVVSSAKEHTAATLGENTSPLCRKQMLLLLTHVVSTFHNSSSSSS